MILSTSGNRTAVWGTTHPLATPGASPSLARPFLALSFLGAALLLLQGFLLLPLVQSDPMFQELPGDASLEQTFWFLRMIAIGATPMILGLRILSLSVVMHALMAALGKHGSWKHLLYRVLQAESIFLLESLCMTVALGLQSPGDLQAAEHIRLRAGLDLLWQSASTHLAAFLAAANIFSLWWAVRLHTAINELYDPGKWTAVYVASLVWLMLVAIRMLLFLG